MSTPMSEPMQRLSEALDAERQALVAHDVHALIRATGAKLDALRALDRALPVGESSQLQELAERNRANGVLLSRRRREVNWALRQLGRSEDAPAYDSKGQSQQMTAGRPLAVA
ncbi:MULTISPECIES: flagella protein [unclassified Stenotrophomonas]|jgi:flagellar biosynthesis/type III secretory pathway chaperone|uniref:flagella protein n=1 Tax=unclassified Stenotrophomonas TaxID=196198 RepID=UPI0005AED22A|nr:MULTISPECIES: flagella protein [unclassified Stenotrophomonas]KIP79618.1 flagella protein [Stenotrophomonas maltophilia]MBD8643043.1 flagellar protein FlgN [Stenotrophomonas sp. CFBP 13724]MDY1033923.1 flagellar protein FlgN [Stenotrophomonas sp. CFBP8980]